MVCGKAGIVSLKAIIALSNAIVRAEKYVITALASVVTLLILLNVATRAGNVALFWVDELAIYAMVWMVLIGASVMVRERSGISASMFVEMLGEASQRVFIMIVDLVVLGFAITLLVLCWYWYDLAELISADFDPDIFASKTLNFIYDEPTNTLGVKKYFIWLVVPMISLSLSLHSTANLIESLNLASDKLEIS